MRKEQYLKDPCAASSLPFWKTNSITTSKKISLVENVLNDSEHEYYFKMIHHLDNIESVQLDNRFEFVEIATIDYANHINSCYDDIGIDIEELEEYKKRRTYNPSLWIAIKDKNNNRIVASGIAEFDDEIKEGIIEWVQVTKEYRRCGLGRIIVNELLNRLKKMALFVTVSGDYNSPSKPLLLYQKCGFTNTKIWHITD